MFRLPIAAVRDENMGKIDEISRAVTQLDGEELQKFQAWYEEFREQRFDEQIARDEKAGKLDKLAEQALANHMAGKSIRFR